MDSEKSLRKQVLFYIKIALFIILVLSAFYFFVNFIALIILFFYIKEYIVLFTASISFTIFMVSTYIAKKLEDTYTEWMVIRGFKPTKFNIRDIFPFIVLLFGGFILIYVFYRYFILFPPTITSDYAKEIIKSLLTINAILIGVHGVIFSQYLRSIYNRGNILYEKMISNNITKDYIVKINDQIKKLQRIRSSLIFNIIYSLMPFIASILFCLNKFTLIEAKNQVPSDKLLAEPLIAFFFGILLMIYLMWRTNILPDTISFNNNVNKE